MGTAPPEYDVDDGGCVDVVRARVRPVELPYPPPATRSGAMVGTARQLIIQFIRLLCAAMRVANARTMITRITTTKGSMIMFRDIGKHVYI